jgi:REP element-mobilizing transposase RayT
MLFHVWFATKNRKWLLQGDLIEAAKQEIARVARDQGIAVLECEAVVDHVHLLLRLADKSELPRAMNSSKGLLHGGCSSNSLS